MIEIEQKLQRGPNAKWWINSGWKEGINEWLNIQILPLQVEGKQTNTIDKLIL